VTGESIQRRLLLQRVNSKPKLLQIKGRPNYRLSPMDAQFIIFIKLIPQ
jgi:hypothetical protein